VQAHDRVSSLAGPGEVLDAPGKDGREQADHRQVAAALAGGLAGGALLVGREALFPADEAERAVGADGGVEQRLVGAAGEGREQRAARLVVEAVDDEARRGQQRVGVVVGEPDAERLGLDAMEVGELQPQRLGLVLADRLLDEGLGQQVL
jgi:hypothetical protein